MSISSPHVTRRILALTEDGPPLTANGPAEVAALLDRFEQVARAEPFFTKSPWQQGGLTLQFQSERWDHDSVAFEVVKDGRFVYRSHWAKGPVPITSERHFLAILGVIRQAAERARALQLRREKVNHLRFKAMEAQVRALAVAAGFEYRFETKANKVKLGIKLSDNRELILDLPFKSFQPVLDTLPAFLPQLRTLLSLPIRFEIGNAQRWSQWQAPPPELQEPAEGED